MLKFWNCLQWRKNIFLWWNKVMIKSLSHQAIGSILCEINDILALYQGREGGSGGRKGTCSHFLGIYLPSKFYEILKIYFLLYSIASHKKFASTHPGLYLSLVYGLCCNVVIVFKCTKGLKTYSKNKLIVMKSFSRSFSIEIDMSRQVWIMITIWNQRYIAQIQKGQKEDRQKNAGSAA